MDYRILGPLEVWDGDRRLTIAAGKPAAVLAYLLLHANEVVAADRLVDALWNSEAPATASKIVQNAVASVRRGLEASGDRRVLLTRSPGYLLEVAPDELDASRFAALVTEGRRALRDGEPSTASARLGEGLALWRGAALADFVYDEFAQGESARLQGLRVEALEDRVDAELALGRHRELVPELERLVEEHPLRERLRGQLMLALYRSGRQTAALDVYADTRRALHDELGLEPGRPLKELQRSILEQDPSLDAPAQPTAERVRRRRRALALAAAGAGIAAVLLAIGTGVFLNRGGGLTSVAPNTVALVEPDSGRLAGEARVPGGPGIVATTGRVVWIQNRLSGTWTVLDEQSGEVRRIAVPDIDAAAVAVQPDAIWLVDRLGRELVAVDPTYGQVAKRIELPAPGGPHVPRTAPAIPSVAADRGAVWVTNGSTQLLRIGSTTGRVQAADLGVGLDAVAAGNGKVWAVSGPSAVAIAVDRRSPRALARVPIAGRTGPLAPFPIAVDIGESAVWVLNANTATLTKIDPELRAVSATVEVGFDRAPNDLAVGSGAAWTANRGDGSVARIDARTGATTITVLGQDPSSIAVGADKVWVTVRGGLVSKVEAPTAALGAQGALPSSMCTPVRYGGPGQPDVLIAVPLSLQGFAAQASAQMAAGVQLAFEDRNWRAGSFNVGFQACNDAERASGFPTPERCEANARAVVSRQRVLGVIGPVYSACSQAMLPILNSAPGGPVPVANGLSTYVGLTRRSPLVPADEPGKYYPSGRRNFVRTIPVDDLQSAGAVSYFHRLGAVRIGVLDDGTAYGSTLARGFVQSARREKLEVAARGQWKQDAVGYAALADRLRAEHVDAVYLAGTFRIGSTLLVDLRAALGPDVVILGSDGFEIVYKELANLGHEIEGLYITSFAPPFDRLGPVGRRFVRELTARIGRRPEVFTVQTASAAEVMLDALARSDGTRSSLSEELLRTDLKSGILGPVSFTATGDVRGGKVTVNRIVHGRVAVVDVIEPPASTFNG
jgi:DNA-binding SARP family transcriptional activator/ABC-type branched-subunit amino acid transport system substrate-binding protein